MPDQAALLLGQPPRPHRLCHHASRAGLPHTIEYQSHGATCHPDPRPVTAARQRDMLTARGLDNPRQDRARAAGPPGWPPPAATG